MKTTTIIIALLIFSPASTIADSYDRGAMSITATASDLIEEGLRFHKQGDFTTAFRLFKSAAEQGNAAGQNNLGSLYEHGQGVPQDYSEAVRWYRKAADQEYAVAQNSLAILYENGQGIPQDHSEAVRWYRKAADQGNASAQSNLGLLYANSRNYIGAAEWYRKAADQGNANAQINLGVLYEHGRGVEQDFDQAAYWYRKAADQGEAAGLFNLGNLYHQNLRQICGFNLACGLKQLAISEQLYRKAAAQGLLSAKLNLGVLLSSDMFKANEGKQLLREVANSNDPELARKAIIELNQVAAHEAAVEQSFREKQQMDDEWAQQQQQTLEFNQQMMDIMDSK